MPRNRWTEELDRRASTLSAAGMFGLFIFGQLVLIISAMAALGGFLMVVGALGSGWTARAIGAGVLLAATVGFYLGGWASREFSVQRKL